MLKFFINDGKKMKYGLRKRPICKYANKKGYGECYTKKEYGIYGKCVAEHKKEIKT